MTLIYIIMLTLIRFTCMHIFHAVCMDMEFRVNNKSSGQGRIMEVCIDDQWHEITSTAKAVNNSSSLQDVSIQADSTYQAQHTSAVSMHTY